MHKTEIDKLKEELEFYKGIVQQANVMLHISEIVDDKYLKLTWANQFYIDNCGHSIEERNNNLEKHSKEKYTEGDHEVVAAIIKTMKQDKKPYSGMYKFYIEDKDTVTWTYSSVVPYQFNEAGVLTHVLISSVFLTKNSFNPERILDLKREVTRLEHQLGLSKLTNTESKILFELAKGKSEKEIADSFSRSLHTIRTHLKKMRKKLNVGKNTELVRYAYEAGIV